MSHNRLHDLNQTNHIDVEQLIKMLPGEPLKSCKFVDSGIIHEDVDRSQLLRDCLRKYLRALRFCDVALYCDCLAAFGHDLANNLFGSSLILDEVHRNRGPTLREFSCDACANSFRSAGDK